MTRFFEWLSRHTWWHRVRGHFVYSLHSHASEHIVCYDCDRYWTGRYKGY